MQTESLSYLQKTVALSKAGKHSNLLYYKVISSKYILLNVYINTFICICSITQIPVININTSSC